MSLAAKLLKAKAALGLGDDDAPATASQYRSNKQHRAEA